MALDKGEANLILSPAERCIADHPADMPFEERHVVIGDVGNPLLGASISKQDFHAAGHAALPRPKWL